MAGLELNYTDIDSLEMNKAKTTLETLNFNCLLSIFDFLDSESLMLMCRVNDYFNMCVLKYSHILQKKWFRMEDKYSIMPVFRDYGRFMRKLEIIYGAEDRPEFDKYSHFLKGVTNYLTPGSLTELNIDIPICKVNTQLLQSARPFFCNLKALSFSSFEGRRHRQDQVLGELIGHAFKLRDLSVCFTNTSCQWLRFEHLNNLERLQIRFNRYPTLQFIQEFIERKPRLKSFDFSAMPIQRFLICCWVVAHIPWLEEFKIANRYEELPHGDDFDFADRPFNREHDFNYGGSLASIDYTDFGDRGVFSDDEMYFSSDDEPSFSSDDDISLSELDSDSDESIEHLEDDLPFYLPSAASWKKVHSSVAKMPNLKKLWIRSFYDCCIDLIDALNALAKHGAIEELTIQAETVVTWNTRFKKQAIMFTNFESVERFRFISPSVGALPFLDQFITAMPNAKTFIVDASEECANVCDLIIMIVERSANAEALVLKMPSTYFNHILYMKLIRIQKLKCVKSNMVKPLKVYISSKRQARICKTHLGKEYNDKLIAINAKSFTDWFENPL